MRLPASVLFALLAAAACQPPPSKCLDTPATRTAPPGVVRAAFDSGDLRLTVEVLDDDLVHFELSRLQGRAGSSPGPIPVTPMVHKVDYTGPRSISRPRPGVLVTPELEVAVNPKTLAVTVRSARGDKATFTTAGPLLRAGALAGLTLSRSGVSHAYGLGQQFPEPGQTDGDWLGKVRAPGNKYGNKMVPYAGGAVGNTQIPVLYALGLGLHNHALMVDQPQALRWDLREDPWTVTLESDTVRWYFLAGPDLPDLRRDYMELTGRPPVPPAKAFGLWVSEYGYRDWAHVDGKLATLGQHGFPVEGVVLDLFWFGGITSGSPQSRMGSLRWDTSKFPDAKKNLARLRRAGVGVVVIEESYISKGLPEFGVLSQAGYLVRRKTAAGVPLFMDSWWGAGGMLDWTSTAAGDFWHDYRRAALVEAGVLGHWTDLGEPEDFDAAGWYHGLPPHRGHGHAAVANLYNLAWARSIHRGYGRQRTRQRPWILSRSGAGGIQRHGVAIWSGDIGSNLRSLRAHFNAQLHMSLSGVDYYGSDIGGFHRKALEGDLDELYTQWFACGAAVDVPVRPHTMNLPGKHETAPDRVGHRPSNLANIKLRRRLGPYLYSLAHLAHRRGEAVFPPLVYHFQSDPVVRRMGSQKMIGPNLMVALAARQKEETTDVYLPAGRWFDYHTGEQVADRGQTGVWLRKVPLKTSGGLFRLPLYARAGAVIPERAPVDDHTLRARVFPGQGASSFDLFEDDGQTVAYLQGQVRTTRISQEMNGKQVTVTMDPARGSYEGAPTARAREVLLVFQKGVSKVELDGKPLKLLGAGAEKKSVGWVQEGAVTRARSAVLPVGQKAVFVFYFKD